MALRVNTNIQALNAERNLGINSKQLGRALERLSSGLRINRAADDAAGLAISETLRSQVRGLNQASANAQDGINLVQTAEGGIDQISAILQRVRELAIQSANDTATQADRQKIQVEIDQLKEEITRIAVATEFNGRKLLNGDLAASAARVDAVGEIKNNVRVGKIEGGTPQFTDLLIGTSSVFATNTVDAAYSIKILASAASTVGFMIEIRGSNGFYSLYRDASALSDAEVTIGPSGSAVTLNFSTFLAAGGAASITADDVGRVALVQLTATRAPVTKDEGLTFQVGANEGQFMRVNFADLTAKSLRLEGQGVLGTTDTDSQVRAQNLVGIVDDALKFVNTQRARIGAFQNRLESTITNLDIAAENLTNAQARIRDVDVAKETTELTRAQILSQAGTAILAQANATSQNALSLLR